MPTLSTNSDGNFRATSVMNAACPLCAASEQTPLWQDIFCRVVLIDDPDYPGFCRVIWNNHVKEMTDLAPDERAHFMQIVFAVETVLRELLTPDKINLASLGNQIPHLHWHVIPRFTDDAHFPNPVWAERTRAGRKMSAPDTVILRGLLSESLRSK